VPITYIVWNLRGPCGNYFRGTNVHFPDAGMTNSSYLPSRCPIYFAAWYVCRVSIFRTVGRFLFCS
jgi:hypothetical protein